MVAVVHGTVILPISVATFFERDRSDTSLLLTCEKEFQGGMGTPTLFPFLATEIAELVLATTPAYILALLVLAIIDNHSRHVVTAEAMLNKHQTS